MRRGAFVARAAPRSQAATVGSDLNRALQEILKRMRSQAAETLSGVDRTYRVYDILRYAPEKLSEN